MQIITVIILVCAGVNFFAGDVCMLYLEYLTNKTLFYQLLVCHLIPSL
ncbi:MAG: hypothetical protein LBF12_03145 [Christensenellaceae bacterium]|nr:hypothetical protein [Christensenellaceae bacterium]